MREVRFMQTKRLRFALLINVLALTACGGGGNAGSVPSTLSIPLAKSSLALTVVVPAPRVTAGRRRTMYVSPSTQSLSVIVKAGTATVLQQAVGLTVASNPANCTAAGGATTCTVLLGLAAGSYTGTFATYAGPVVNGTASGAVLSSGQSLPMVAIAGQTNTISLTLDGVPASIVIAPASGSSITGTQTGAGFVVGYTAQALTVEALDAGSNIIVGAGAPTFTASTTGNNFSVTQPQTGTPNQLLIAATTAGSSALTVTAAPADGGFSCTSSGVVCSATVPITTPLHKLFVAGFNGFAAYTSPDDVTWTLTASSTGTVSEPEGVVYAPNGDAIVLDAGSPPFPPPGSPASISIFAPPYSGAPVQNTHVGLPTAPAMTASGNLLFQDSGNLEELAAPYTSSPTTTATGVNAYGIVIDSFGNVVVSQTYPSAATLSFAQPSFATPTTLATGIGGGIAVSPTGTVAVGTLPMPYEFAVFSVPYGAPTLISLGGSQPDGGVTFDSNGNLWAQLNDTSLRKYSAPFSTNESASVTVSVGFTANMIAADSSGDVFALNGTSVKIYSPTGTLTQTLTPAGGAVAMTYVK
jgi:hypothetical protein